MKMILKNKEGRKLNFLTIKNYKVFLISFFAISVIIGVVFYLYLNSNDKELINNNITNYFTVKDNYNYFNSLLVSLKNNIQLIVIIWLLGISVIGNLYNIFVYFIEGFSIGFICTAIIKLFGIKGILGSLIYLFPSKLIYLIIIFMLTYFSILFSINLIRYFFLKEDINLKEKMKKYTKVLIICLVLGVVCSIFEVFIDTFIIKAFTFLFK